MLIYTLLDSVGLLKKMKSSSPSLVSSLMCDELFKAAQHIDSNMKFYEVELWREFREHCRMLSSLPPWRSSRSCLMPRRTSTRAPRTSWPSSVYSPLPTPHPPRGGGGPGPLPGGLCALYGHDGHHHCGMICKEYCWYSTLA